MFMKRDLYLEGTECTYIGKWELPKIGPFQISLAGRDCKLSGYLNLSDEITSFVKMLGRRILHDKLKVIGCYTCKNFYYTGMALDMRNGEVGTCRTHSCLVDICFCCKYYSSSNMDAKR